MLNDVGNNISQSDIYKIIGRKFILQIFPKSIANNYEGYVPLFTANSILFLFNIR